MAYLVTGNIQAWLQNTKFNVQSVNADHEQSAVNTVFGKLGKRYDTSLWTDNTNTPPLVLSLLAMWMASIHLRVAASEEDGLVSYADYLEGRVDSLCQSIVDGDIDIGTAEDPTTALGGSAEFFPDDAATDLWEANHGFDGSSYEEGAAARAFTMQQRF